MILTDGKGLHFQSLEISRPVTPPLPFKWGVWENYKLLESAAGVALSFGLKKVSVQKPIEKESNVLADIGKVCRLLGLRCLQCVMRGLQVVVIVLICKHIVRICYKN